MNKRQYKKKFHNDKSFRILEMKRAQDRINKELSFIKEKEVEKISSYPCINIMVSEGDEDKIKNMLHELQTKIQKQSYIKEEN